MTPEQFCYWLQGRAELQPDTPPSPAEWQSIREHLATVFNKVTPPAPLTFRAADMCYTPPTDTGTYYRFDNGRSWLSC